MSGTDVRLCKDCVHWVPESDTGYALWGMCAAMWREERDALTVREAVDRLVMDEHECSAAEGFEPFAEVAR